MDTSFHSNTNFLVNNQPDALFSMYLFISLLYMFRATQCSSSGESNHINTSFGMYLGLLTGHNTLRRHLHIMGLCDSPICRKCGVGGGESSVHILCQCEALASLRHTYLGSFFLDPEDIRVLGVGPSGTLLREQGSYNQVQSTGHKGPVLRPR